jgi:hypothetical protein
MLQCVGGVSTGPPLTALPVWCACSARRFDVILSPNRRIIATGPMFAIYLVTRSAVGVLCDEAPSPDRLRVPGQCSPSRA